MNVPLTFEIYKGDQLLKTETLTQDIIKIGKLSSSHLRIDDEDISRMHAVIEITSPTEIHIIDLGSSKGTVVNGQKVTKTRLSSGDSVMLGGVKLVVTIGEAVAAATAEEPAQASRQTVMGMAAAPIAAAAAVPPPAAAAAAPAPVAAAAAPAPAAPRAAAPAPRAGAPAGGAPATFMGHAIDPGQIEVRDGSKAVEVMAMFDAAVVEARHFTNPKSGNVSGQTKGMIYGGAVGLVASMVLFIVAFVQVTREKAALEASGGSAAQLSHGGSAIDILVAFLLVAGLVSLVLGLFRRQEEIQPRDFTIGPDPTAVYNAPGENLPVPLFPLVQSTGTSYQLLFTQHMKGDVTFDGKTRVSLADTVSQGKAHPASGVSGAFAMSIADGMRAKVDFGNSTFLVNSVPPPRRHPVPVNFDWRANSYTGGTFVVMALFLAMIFSIPPDPKSLSLDAFMNDQRFAKFLIKPPEEKEEQIPEWLKKKSPDDAGGKGKRHKGEEGKMGKKTSKNKAGLYALKGPQDNKDLHLAKQFAEDQAKNAGVLGILKREEGSHLASIFGRDSALGNDADNVMGGLVGTAVARPTASAAWAWSARGAAAAARVKAPSASETWAPSARAAAAARARATAVAPAVSAVVAPTPPTWSPAPRRSAARSTRRSSAASSGATSTR